MAIIDVTDPGVVNVEAQAYPPVPGSAQALPTPVLVDASSQGAVPLRPLLQALPLSSDVFVEDVSLLPLPSFSRGTVDPDVREVDVSAQNLTSVSVDTFLVTEVGSVRVGPPGIPDSVTLAIATILDADTLGPVTSSTTRYRITLASSLASYGVGIVGRQATVESSVTPGNVGQSMIISFWSGNLIVIPRQVGSLTFSTNLQVGATLAIDVGRDGTGAFYELVASESDVLVQPQLLVPPTTTGTSFSSTGVVSPVEMRAS